MDTCLVSYLLLCNFNWCQKILSFSVDKMPEGGSSQNAGHSILDGLYELHQTVGTGGFAKVREAKILITGSFKRQTYQQKYGRRSTHIFNTSAKWSGDIFFNYCPKLIVSVDAGFCTSILLF